MNVDQLIGERNALARAIIALEGVARAGLMVRKPPQAIALLQNEILSMRARVREIDRAIKQKQSNVG
jgi:Tfp pilus assembly protein PilN